MKISGNTVLITGGSAGIGFEIARLFSRDNKVIITGRDKKRLDNAVSQLDNTTGIISDASKAEDAQALVDIIQMDFSDLNIVVNNAGHAFLYDLATGTGAVEKAYEEMLTNYLSVIRLNEKLIPTLAGKDNAAIVNVSSVVALVPSKLSTYSASKAALHSYTQALRISLERAGSIKVFELMPPLVNTEFSQMIGGSTGISPVEVATHLINAIEKDVYEIRVGNTQKIYDLYLKSPAEALFAMNGGRE